MNSENPVETANSLREAVSAMIEAGIYNVASLNELLMPMYNAEVQAGLMTKERMKKLEEIIEKANSAGEDQERRLQFYLAMFEVLTERRFAACHKDTDAIYAELSPHNAKLWQELQENHRDLEKKKTGFQKKGLSTTSPYLKACSRLLLQTLKGNDNSGNFPLSSMQRSKAGKENVIKPFI